MNVRNECRSFLTVNLKFNIFVKPSQPLCISRMTRRVFTCIPQDQTVNKDFYCGVLRNNIWLKQPRLWICLPVNFSCASMEWFKNSSRARTSAEVHRETTPKMGSVWFNDLWFSNKHIVNSYIVKVKALMCGFIVSPRKIFDVEATFSTFFCLLRWMATSTSLIPHKESDFKGSLKYFALWQKCSAKWRTTGSWVIKQDGCWHTCLLWRMQSLRLSSVKVIVISCVWAEGFWRFMRRCFLRGFFSQLCGMWGIQA